MNSRIKINVYYNFTCLYPCTFLLEPYPKGTYVTYPYLGSHCDRVLVLLAVIRYTRYLITTRYRMEFLHTILHVA